jgi:hypothetical protein
MQHAAPLLLPLAICTSRSLPPSNHSNACTKIQLGSLRKLEWLRIYHYCMRGVLPPSLLEALPSLTNVRLQAEFGAENYVPQDGGGECGIRGQIPQRWARPMVNLTEMVLRE